MSQVDKHALRKAALNAKTAGDAPVMSFGQRISAINAFTNFLTPAMVIALLDENESLEKRVAELAVENADLKHPGTYLPSKIDTPATDAFINEIRAKGVEMLAAEYESKIEPYKNYDEFMNAHYLKMQANEARNFAQKLREAKA